MQLPQADIEIIQTIAKEISDLKKSGTATHADMAAARFRWGLLQQL
jgi:hypothetical protein